MATEKNIGSVMQKIVYRDDDGEIVASAKINASDSRLPARLKEFAANAKQMAQRPAAADPVEEFCRGDDQLADLFCQLLGYDCKKSLFGIVSPTTVLGDGRIFAACVLEDIKSVAKPELERAARARRLALDKHLRKYQ